MDIARIASWPPEWWGMWWPRRLRRPTDLWVRLPWQARLVRIVLTAFLVGLPGLILLRHWLAARDASAADGALDTTFASAEATLVIAVGALVAATLWWARRRGGLTLAEATRVLFGATLPAPVWNAPHVARLLSLGVGDVRPPDPEIPADYRRAIREVRDMLPSTAASLGAEVVSVADRLNAEIDACDAEARSLTRDAGPAEIDRLTAQLASMQSSPGAENADRRALRALVEHQLDVVRRLHQRHELVAQRRAHLFHLLRGLWSQLCLWRTAIDTDPAGELRLRDQLVALCAEIGHEVQASRVTVEPRSGD